MSAPLVCFVDALDMLELPAKQFGSEQWLEELLESDITAVDPDLMVIGRQVPTSYGGKIDLLCLDVEGNLVVVELKRGRTPRDVTAQALDYSSWVKDLGFSDVARIANAHLGGSGPLEKAFKERFDADLPDSLNLGHRSLIVAGSIDAATERIVRYLSEQGVPINVAGVRHFQDASGRELIAQVYLIEPEVAQAKAHSTSSSSVYRTVNGLQSLADENGVGELYRSLRDGVRGIFSARGYSQTVGYIWKLDGGGVRTLMLVSAVPGDDGGGLDFTVHATRFEKYLGVGVDELRGWLPQNSEVSDTSTWSGSSPEEKQSAVGLHGRFHSGDEVERFVDRLRSRVG